MTIRSDDLGHSRDRKTVASAVLRMLLGQLQMMGAIFSAVLLFRFGVSQLTLEAVGATTALTLISILLFRVIPWWRAR